MRNMSIDDRLNPNSEKKPGAEESDTPDHANALPHEFSY